MSLTEGLVESQLFISIFPQHLFLASFIQYFSLSFVQKWCLFLFPLFLNNLNRNKYQLCSTQLLLIFYSRRIWSQFQHVQYYLKSLSVRLFLFFLICQILYQVKKAVFDLGYQFTRSNYFFCWSGLFLYLGFIRQKFWHRCK